MKSIQNVIFGALTWIILSFLNGTLFSDNAIELHVSTTLAAPQVEDILVF